MNNAFGFDEMWGIDSDGYFTYKKYWCPELPNFSLNIRMMLIHFIRMNPRFKQTAFEAKLIQMQKKIYDDYFSFAIPRVLRGYKMKPSLVYMFKKRQFGDLVKADLMKIYEAEEDLLLKIVQDKKQTNKSAINVPV
jgi:hypothetical protein